MIKHIFRRSGRYINDFFIFDKSRVVPGCETAGHMNCLCKMTAVGLNQFAGYTYEINVESTCVKKSCQDFSADLLSKYRMEQGQIMPYDGDFEVDRFVSRIPPKQDFILTPTQLRHAIFPSSVDLVMPSPLVKKFLRRLMRDILRNCVLSLLRRNRREGGLERYGWMIRVTCLVKMNGKRVIMVVNVTATIPGSIRKTEYRLSKVWH